MTVVVQWCNYILPICLKPSHIYATQYKPYNACTCTKSMKLKICINSIIITCTCIDIRIFLKISRDKMSLINEKFKDGI